MHVRVRRWCACVAWVRGVAGGAAGAAQRRLMTIKRRPGNGKGCAGSRGAAGWPRESRSRLNGARGAERHVRCLSPQPGVTLTPALAEGVVCS